MASKGVSSQVVGEVRLRVCGFVRVWSCGSGFGFYSLGASKSALRTHTLAERRSLCVKTGDPGPASRVWRARNDIRRQSA
eukprot:720379-Rhodomonas_salina.2